jgi:hypothetical protein
MSTRYTSQKKAPSSHGYIHIPLVFLDQPDVQATFCMSSENYTFLCELSDFLRKLLPNEFIFDRHLTLFGGMVLKILSGKPTSDIDVAIQNGPLGPSVMEQLNVNNSILVSGGKQFLCSKHAVVSEEGKLSTEIIAEISEAQNGYSTVTLDTNGFGKIDLVKMIRNEIMDARANSIRITMNPGHKFKVFATTEALWELFNNNVFPLQLARLLPDCFARPYDCVDQAKKLAKKRYTHVLRRLWKLINKFETVQCVSAEGGEDLISLEDLKPVTEMKQLLDLMITSACGHQLTVRTLYGQVMSKLTTVRDGTQVDTQNKCPMCREDLCLQIKTMRLFCLDDLQEKTFRTELADKYGIHIYKYPIRAPKTKTEVDKLSDLLFVEDEVPASHTGGASGAGGPDPFHTPPRAPRRSISSEFHDVDDDVDDDLVGASSLFRL